MSFTIRHYITRARDKTVVSEYNTKRRHTSDKEVLTEYITKRQHANKKKCKANNDSIPTTTNTKQTIAGNLPSRPKADDTGMPTKATQPPNRHGYAGSFFFLGGGGGVGQAMRNTDFLVALAVVAVVAAVVVILFP